MRAPRIVRRVRGLIRGRVFGIWSAADFDSLADAVAAIGATPATLTLPAGTYPVAANLTVPATLGLRPLEGASVEPAAAVTLTIEGPISPAPYKWLAPADAGGVRINSGDPVDSRWFLSSRTAAVDQSLEIQAAFNSTADAGTAVPIDWFKGDYAFATPLVLHQYCWIRGADFSGVTPSVHFRYDGARGAGVRAISFSGGTFRGRLQGFNVNLVQTGADPWDLGTGVYVENPTFYDFLESVFVERFQTGYHVAGASNFVIRMVRPMAQNCQWDMLLEGTLNNVRIEHPVFINTGTATSKGQRVRITGGGSAIGIYDPDFNGGTVDSDVHVLGAAQVTVVNPYCESNATRHFYAGNAGAYIAVFGGYLKDGGRPAEVGADGASVLLYGQKWRQITNTEILDSSPSGAGHYRVVDCYDSTADLMRNKARGRFGGGGAYTVTNGLTDRAFDADAVTLAELADVVATMIVDLKAQAVLR